MEGLEVLIFEKAKKERERESKDNEQLVEGAILKVYQKKRGGGAMKTE